MNNRPIIFTEPDCPACEAEKIRMTVAGVDYIERTATEIDTHPARNEIMAQLAMQGMALPVIWEDGRARGAGGNE